MDKHTRRYLSEHFNHYSENIGMRDVLSYVNQAKGDDHIYLQGAIYEGDFTQEQRQYLQFKLWDKFFGGND